MKKIIVLVLVGNMSGGVLASSGYSGARRDLHYLAQTGLDLLRFAYSALSSQGPFSEEDEYREYQLSQAQRAQPKSDGSPAVGSLFSLPHSPITRPSSPRQSAIAAEYEQAPNFFSDEESDGASSSASSIASFIRQEANCGISYVRTRAAVAGHVNSEIDPQAVAALFAADDAGSVDSNCSEFSLPSNSELLLANDGARQDRARHSPHSATSSFTSTLSFESDVSTGAARSARLSVPALVAPHNSFSSQMSGPCGSPRIAVAEQLQQLAAVTIASTQSVRSASPRMPMQDQLENAGEGTVSVESDFVIVQMPEDLEQVTQIFEGWDALHFEEPQDPYGLTIDHVAARKP